MSSNAPISRRRSHLVAGSISAVSVLFLASCSGDAEESSDPSPSQEASVDAGLTPPPAEPTSETVVDEAPPGGSGPDGTYVVGDTFVDVDFDFTYEGLVQVPLDTLGKYTEGECYFAIGTAEYREDSPSASISSTDSFRASFAPIIAGTVDKDQDDEFFNCDASVVGAAGYEQSTTADVPLGESLPVWLDAIYLSPDRVGQLDGFQLYGSEDLVFSAEVTQDLTG